MPSPRVWTEEAIIAAVQTFYREHDRWPGRRDFMGAHPGLPSLPLVMRRMRTWEEAVRQAQQEAQVCP